MILQGVKLTIQPLGVGYANRPKKAQNRGACGIFPYIRLPGFDLTTSRGDSSIVAIFYCIVQFCRDVFDYPPPLVQAPPKAQKRQFH